MVEKAVRKTTTKIKKTARKATPKKGASKPSALKSVGTKKKLQKTTRRKAPTSVAAENAYRKKGGKILTSGVVVFLVVTIGSIALGMSGSGEISIETRVSNLREQATPEERNLIESIPVQNTQLPDGGLVPSGVPEEKPEPVPIASSTEQSATTTEQNATSTDTITVDKDLPLDEEMNTLEDDFEDTITTDAL